jgi:predicted  nucleic acid-binding Zn-ribbon protein
LKEQIRLLEALQEIDSQIDGYERDMMRLPLEIQETAKTLVVLRRDISDATTKSSTVEKELRKREQELALEQEKIKRSERRLLSIKNQKEYNALSREVKLGKKVAAEIEEAILEFMSQLEALKKTLERKENEYAECEATLLAKKAEAEQVTARSQEALTALKAEREKVTAQVESDFLKKYRTLKQARGNAVAEMQNGTCTGCHMAIPPQLNIRILKQEEMITCPNCHRILYVKPENIPEFNKIDS